MTEPTPREVASLAFYNPDMNGKLLQDYRRHPLFGPVVEKFIEEGRTDIKNLRVQLRHMQISAKRRRKWLGAFNRTHDEVKACGEAHVVYATFCKWRNQDSDFKANYEAIRELRGRKLVDKARQIANTDEGATDRWNIIKTEVPEYNPKKERATITLSLNGDIDFKPKGTMRPVETSAE